MVAVVVAVASLGAVGAGRAPDTSAGPVVVLDLVDGGGAAAAELRAVVAQVLADPRGWSAAGVTIELGEGGVERLGLAGSADMAQACAPWGTTGKYGCRPGPVAMINVERWATPPEWWTGTPEAYRVHAVNHELGHIIGLRGHPGCPGDGAALPVMALPSREEVDCTMGGWPTEADLHLARSLLAEGR